MASSRVDDSRVDGLFVMSVNVPPLDSFVKLHIAAVVIEEDAVTVRIPRHHRHKFRLATELRHRQSHLPSPPGVARRHRVMATSAERHNVRWPPIPAPRPEFTVVHLRETPLATTLAGYLPTNPLVVVAVRAQGPALHNHAGRRGAELSHRFDQTLDRRASTQRRAP